MKTRNQHLVKAIQRVSVTLLLILTVLVSPCFLASAEEGGYWTMTTDSEGMPVMIYTYTEPVEWVINEQSGYGYGPDESVQPLYQSEQAKVHLSDQADSRETPAPAVQPLAEQPVQALPMILCLSVTLLLTLGIIRLVHHRRVRIPEKF